MAHHGAAPVDGRAAPDPARAAAVLDALSRLAADTRSCEAPAAVQARLRELVLDTLAVTAWGCRREELARLREVVGGVPLGGAATVFGTSLRRPAAVACGLNGSAAAADQLQDGHRAARGHPAAHVVLGVFALAEETNASTEAVLSAVLAGYEVGARIGIAMGGTRKGVHDIGTWGSLATAVGVAHLLRPRDPEVMRRTIELAASAVLLTDATTIFTGHTGGHAYLGASISHGLWLGQAAVAGLGAAPGSIDRFFAPQSAALWSGLPALEDGGWGEHEVLKGYVKLHPTCAHLHGVLDALEDGMAELEERHAGVADVERVRVSTYAAAAAFSAPASNELQARFSIPTSVALTLLHQGLDAPTITDTALGSPAVQDLARRVEVRADPELEDGYPEGRPSSVEITLHDGSVVRAHSALPRGDADGSESRDAVADKAVRLLRSTFGTAADTLLATVDGWPQTHSPRELGEAFRQAAQHVEEPGR